MSDWDLPTRVSELMSRRLVTIGPDDDLAFAMQLMLWSGVRHLPVVDGESLVGILSDRDLLPVEGTGTMKAFLEQPVPSAMTEEVQSIGPDENARSASARMVTANINCLPVVEDDRVVGIITSSDILAERGGLFFKSRCGEVPAVGDLMTVSPSRVHRDASLREVATRMVDEGIRHLPVVDDEGAVAGMLSDRDLRGVLGDLRGFLQGGETVLDDKRVEDVMTPNPRTMPQGASLFHLASCFVDDRVEAVPVVDDSERLAGVVSYVDLIGFLLKGR
jgi:CBS-domain-containing membrane protein